MKRISKRSLAVFLFSFVLAFALAPSAPALAQTVTNNAITGHVKDPQGASLPGATVTLYSRDGALNLTTTTDSGGAYRFEKLAPGEYLVEAVAQGFASASAQQVVVDRGQVSTLDISLELSGVRSTVVVTLLRMTSPFVASIVAWKPECSGTRWPLLLTSKS